MKHIFYYTILLLRKIKTNDDPLFNSYLLVTFIQVINFYTLLGLLLKVFNIRVAKDVVVIFSILLYVSLCIVNYFLLIKRKDEAEKEYLESSISRKRLNAIIVLLYYTFSIVFGILVLTYVA